MARRCSAPSKKRDAERLARLRQQHEIALQHLTKDVRFLQWKQAESSTESLLRTRASALERIHYYQRVLAIQDTPVKDVLALDRRALTAEGFDEAYAALVAAYDTAAATRPYPRLSLACDALPAVVADSGKLALTVPEATELNVLMPAAATAHLAASVTDTVSGVLAFIPDITVDLQYWELGASTFVFGGTKLAQSGRLVADVIRAVGTMAQDAASQAVRAAGYERRVDE